MSEINWITIMKLPACPQEAESNNILKQAGELWDIIVDPHAKRALTGFAATITGVIAANAVAQIRLNNWQGNIYDAIGQREVSVFLHEVVVFLVIVGVLLCLNVAQNWLHETLKVRLRQAITYNLLDEWLKPHRIVQLRLAGEISANPDQRIQDDAKRLSELTVDLGVGLLQSSLLLLAFVGVLWQLSAQVVFRVSGEAVTIPGYMVWAAFCYSLIGSFLTWFVGRPLIRAHTDLRAKEAEFRFALVRLSESSGEIALHRGERQERLLLEAPVDALLLTMRHIANRLAGLTWVTGGYGWLAILAPLLLAAPGYFGGTLSLGGLMMVVGAFYQVQTALRWFIDRFPVIAEWRAMLARISSYRGALKEVPSLGAKMARIHFDMAASAISIEDLWVFAPNGRIRLGAGHLKVEPGERVLIEATPKSGKSIFLKALAGIWVWGTGTVRLPGEHILFLPQSPYIPIGSLRTALVYPEKADAYSDDAVHDVLARVQLDQFASGLDAIKRWDRELTIEEQRRFVFGRTLLHRPLWIIQDESISELDEQSRELVLSIFDSELKETAVLSVGRHDPEERFYSRILRLRTRPTGLRLPLQFESGFEQSEAETAVG